MPNNMFWLSKLKKYTEICKPKFLSETMKERKLPSPLLSLLPIAVLVAMLAVTIHLFGSDALGGGSQVCLLAATGVCVLIGMAGFQRKWKHFEKAITNNISGVATALMPHGSAFVVQKYS